MKDKNILNNVGKSVGNGSKATLPNGENLSDKIQQNKVNQGVNGTNKFQNSNNSSLGMDNSNDDKKETKSKEEQAVGNVASEALKTSLKASFPYIPQFVINKLVDSKLGQTLIERQLREVKTKMIFGIIGVVITVLLLLFIVAAMVTLIISPIAFVQDAWKSVSDEVISFGNFVLGRGWCSDNCEDNLRSYYYNRLNVEAENYKKQCNVDLNKELITATIFYDRMVSKESSDVEGGQFDLQEGTGKFYYKYSKDDASEVLDLIDVYKNQNYKATCPTITETSEKVINDFISLIKGRFTSADLDNLILEHNIIPTIADIENKIGKLTSEETTLWNEIVVIAKDSVSCFSGIWMRIKSVIGAADNPCLFNEENYKSYLINYYIPTNYAYLTNDKYKMTYEEIAEEILQLGDRQIGSEYEEGASGQIVIGSGVAGAIPVEILSNVISPLGNQQMSHTSCFGFYSPSNCTGHNGIDISSSVTDPKIYSIADGEVIRVVKSAFHCQPDWKGGKACSVCPQSGGNRVTVKHTIDVNGKIYEFYSEYLHLKSVNVDLNQKVSRGQQIGIMGNTGCSTGKHLHFNMLDGSKKVYNPEELLQYFNLPMQKNCNEARRVCSR